MSDRAAPFYCPYCGDEDLRPSEAGHGSWECAACARAFQLRFLGLLANGAQGTAPAHQGTASQSTAHQRRDSQGGVA